MGAESAGLVPVPERLFILGSPRSGTTFLASLLRGTRFGAPIESHFILKYLDRLDGRTRIASVAEFEGLVRDLLRERPVMQWDLDVTPRTLREASGAADAPVEYARLVDALFLSRAEARGRSAWGDKTPHYLDRVGDLDRLFPDARYLYIVRDGRDVALSLLEKPWGPNNIHACAVQWARMNAPSRTLDELRRQDRLHFVRYEDLLRRPEEHLQAIGAFLDERFDAAEMERLARTAKPANVLKWKATMPVSQARTFESVARGTLERLGYETNHPDATTAPVAAHAYRLHDRAAWMAFMAKTNLLDGFRIRFLGKAPFAE